MRLPLVPGIDFAGTVLASEHADFAPGENVILNGWGCGERRPGGYAERARVSGDWLIKRPAVFTNAETMAIGTAGYTAMLAMLALEDHGVTPDKGPVLVTGAAGGVGSVAVTLLHKLGYRVVASTGRAQEADYLRAPWRCGNHLPRRAVVSGARHARQRALGGRHRCCRVAHLGKCHRHDAVRRLRRRHGTGAGPRPAVVRGAVHPAWRHPRRHRQRDGARAKRERAWERLAADLDRGALAEMSVTRPLADVVALAPEILAGKVRGRVVLEVG